MTMRALFLDFDGVTHPVSDIEDWRTLNVHGADINHLIEKRKLFRWMPLLTQALDEHPDVVVVVHSGWRAVLDNTRMRYILGPDLGQRFMGVTSSALSRHEGIEDLANRAGIDEFIVIDDAIHEFPKNYEHLIATDPEVGISDPGVLQSLGAWLKQTAQSQRPAVSMCS